MINNTIRNDISNFCKYHPNNPVAVSPQWVVDCSKQSCLLDPNQYPPITMIEKKAAEIERKEVNVQQQKALSHNDNEAKNEISDQNTDYCETSSLLFQGAIFHLVHHSLSNKAENQQVTFDPKTIEKMIIKNGGHLLTEQVVNLIQHEEEIIHQRGHTGSNTNQSPTKTDVDFICYAINLNGPFNIQNSFNLSTLLSTIHQSKVCTIIPVTPIWMEACIANETVYQPDEYPTLFQPQTWPLTKIPSEIKIKVSVSGFQNSERSGLKHLLQSIGATYTDNMGNKNTHLICREAKGPKYHKAIEWGLHVVTVDWLYHIVQYGYYGRKDSDCDDYLNRGHEDDQYDHNIYSGSCCGCEKKFTLTFSPRRVQPLNRRIDDDSNIRPSKEFELKQKIIPSAK